MDHPDAQLVAISLGGDREAYGELARRHLRRVFAVCLGVIGERSEAEDAAQEALLEGFRKLHQLREPAQFAAWIGQIARNRSRDALRRRARKRERPLDAAPEPHVPSGEDHHDLHGALARMPEEHRLPLLLYYFDGKDTQTLARELGLTPGGACARLFRARRRLRDLLQEEAARHE
jgi:RNA polymerase sigma-70 factor (ECF subfamily)